MAKQMMDIALRDHKDVLVAGGDFVITESTNEHQVQLLLNNKGDFKQYPSVCVGALNYIDDEGANGLINALSTEFQRDGMNVKQAGIAADGTVQADAYYL